MKDVVKIKPKTKICNKCNRELPLDSDHFYHKNNTKDGYTTKCKECHGYSFTDKLTNMPEDGYCFCNKCKRELPFNVKYFPVDNSKKENLRKICRECCGSSFLTDELKSISAKEWSNEEISILKETYQYYTDDEIVELFLPNRTKKSIGAKAKRLGLPSKTDETHKRSIQKMANTKKEYYKTHSGTRLGKEVSEESRKKMSEAKLKIKKWKGEDNPRHKKPLFGKDNGRWQGGITDTYKTFRNYVRQWQRSSMEFCKYKCVITNKDFDDIHHTTAFKELMILTLKELNLELKQAIEDYSENEFNLICNKINELHNIYGYGACLNKEVHKLFHDNYGYTNITPYDFLDFIYRIDIGEFDKWFKDNNLNIKINYEYIKYLEEILFYMEEMVAM